MTLLWTPGDPLRDVVGTEGLPQRLIWRGRTHPVEHIDRRWRVDNEWWRQRVWRDYFQLSTTTGLLIVVYHDLLADRWYLQRLYD